MQLRYRRHPERRVERNRRLPVRRALLVAWALIALVPSSAAAATQEDKAQFGVIGGSLSFSTLPLLPVLGTVTLNGMAQTTNSTMTNFGVNDATGTGSGWNVTVEGQSGVKKSAVFAQYCPLALCGADVEGYVPSGATLAADSLTLTSTAASFTAQSGATGGPPTLQCSSACNVDHPSAVKIASAAANDGMGTWLTSGFTGTSLSLATPSNLKALSNGELYRVNLLWTLGSGP